MNNDGISTQNINTPEIFASAGTIVAANTKRVYLFIQNVGQNPLFIRFGGTASSTVYHVVLKGGTADSDGLGASITFDRCVPTGLVSMAGTTPKAVVIELAP